MGRKIFATAIVCVSLTGGCKTLNRNSDVKIAGGALHSNPAASAVRQLVINETSICTATFLNATTAITAAHCVKAGPTRPYRLSINGVAPANVIVVSDSFYADLSARLDAAILVFDRPLGDEIGVVHYGTVATADPKPGDQVSVYGFGVNDLRTGANDGRLHWGQNTVHQVDSDLVTVMGVHWADGGQVSPNAGPLSGDSGGPLTTQNAELLGICSQGDQSGQKGEVFYFKLQSPKAKEFFKRAITDCGKGPCAANFPGSGVDDNEADSEKTEEVEAKPSTNPASTTLPFPGNWAPGEPNDTNHTQNCIAATSAGFSDENCDALKPYACHTGNFWVPTMNAGKWNDASCPPQFPWAAPQNQQEINSLRGRAGAESFWINLSDQAQEGVYVPL
ncbi:MAG: trypsin-like serine protease [Oligoflexales bacterium]